MALANSLLTPCFVVNKKQDREYQTWRSFSILEVVDNQHGTTADNKSANTCCEWLSSCSNDKKEEKY
jgi:hypothetical protein